MLPYCGVASAAAALVDLSRQIRGNTFTLLTFHDKALRRDDREACRVVVWSNGAIFLYHRLRVDESKIVASYIGVMLDSFSLKVVSTSSTCLFVVKVTRSDDDDVDVMRTKRRS